MVDGSHIRIDPHKKDLFVTYVTGFGIGFGSDSSLGLAVHQIRGEDEYPAAEEYGTNRVINPNRGNSGSGGTIPGQDQAALRIHDTGLYRYAYFGFTCGIDTGAFEPCEDWIPPQGSEQLKFTPNLTREIKVWVQSHNDLTSTADCPLVNLSPAGGSCPYNSEQMANEIGRTIAHEMGHGIKICHRSGHLEECAPLDETGILPSVMTSSFLGGPAASDPRSRYNAFDVRQIRLIQ
jgi:hypothetical protein